MLFYRNLAGYLSLFLWEPLRPLRNGLLSRALCWVAEGYYLSTWRVNQLLRISVFLLHQDMIELSSVFSASSVSEHELEILVCSAYRFFIPTIPWDGLCQQNKITTRNVLVLPLRIRIPILSFLVLPMGVTNPKRQGWMSGCLKAPQVHVSASGAQLVTLQ